MRRTVSVPPPRQHDAPLPAHPEQRELLANEIPLHPLSPQGMRSSSMRPRAQDVEKHAGRQVHDARRQLEYERRRSGRMRLYWP
jgi:hypothetical protein